MSKTIDQRVRFVTYRFEHHSLHSGYDGVTRYGGTVIRARPLPRKLIRNRVIWWLANVVVAYDRESLATEIKAMWRLLRDERCIYHLIYGENTYHYLGLLNNFRRNRVVATYHLPPSRLQQTVQISWHIQQLSAVICVGHTQMDFFSNLIDRNRVFFVPLGVATDYFAPPSSNEDRNPNLCLFVGSHLRDFATLRGVIELVTFQRPEVQFVVVTSRDNIDRVGMHPGLTLLTNIKEAELLNLYRSAALMAMPLSDAVGNYGILEGMACGLPLVLTDVGSVHDYVSPECAVLVPPNDSRRMAQ